MRQAGREMGVRLSGPGSENRPPAWGWAMSSRIPTAALKTCRSERGFPPT